jgi:cytosine/uracil/thiamine/allantoin permease
LTCCLALGPRAGILLVDEFVVRYKSLVKGSELGKISRDLEL